MSNEAACRGIRRGTSRPADRVEGGSQHAVRRHRRRQEGSRGRREARGRTPHGKPFKFANDQQGFASLLRRLGELVAGPDDCLLVMESTGHYWLALWEFVVAHGYGVAVVNCRKANC